MGNLNGPTVFINGWKAGMNKVGVTRLLHEFGLDMSEAFQLTNQILTFTRDPDDETRFDTGPIIRVQIAEGYDRDEFIGKLRDLGVLIE